MPEGLVPEDFVPEDFVPEDFVPEGLDLEAGENISISIVPDLGYIRNSIVEHVRCLLENKDLFSFNVIFSNFFNFRLYMCFLFCLDGEHDEATNRYK